MRFFNTAGPCDPARHYMVPAAPRLPEARRLIDERAYLALHDLSSLGKTTTLRSLARDLTAEGRYAALHFICEVGEPAGDDFAEAQRRRSCATRRITASPRPAWRWAPIARVPSRPRPRPSAPQARSPR